MPLKIAAGYYYKIGATNNVKNRKKSLKIAFPIDVQILAEFSNYKEALLCERELQFENQAYKALPEIVAKFTSGRVYKNYPEGYTEWFLKKIGGIMSSVSIAALVYISESEISEIYEDYHDSWEEDQPEKFKKILFQFGLDISQPYQKQENLTHRNMMSKIVKCHRWVGNSRLDTEWIRSGMASREAIDKANGTRLLIDIYRAKGLTTDRAGGVFEPEDFEKNN